MIIYKDRITGDEMLSDTFKMEEIDDCYLRVEGKQVTESAGGIDDSLIGGNASAEGGGDEGAESGSVSGVDIVLRHRLQSTPFDKKSFQTYIKNYSKSLLEILEKEDEDRAKKFKSGMPKVVKLILGSFKDWEFYTGESCNPEGMVVALNWTDGDDSYPFMIFFKDAMTSEKV